MSSSSRCRRCTGVTPGEAGPRSGGRARPGSPPRSACPPTPPSPRGSHRHGRHVRPCPASALAGPGSPAAWPSSAARSGPARGTGPHAGWSTGCSRRRPPAPRRFDRSHPTGTASAPTTERYTRCRTSARDAAATSLRVAPSSPLGPPARCRTVPAPATARSSPSSVSRSPVTYSRPVAGRWAPRPSTRTCAPALRSRGTTCLPSVPVPPVTPGSVMSRLSPLVRCGGFALPVTSVGPVGSTSMPRREGGM